MYYVHYFRISKDNNVLKKRFGDDIIFSQGMILC